MTHNLQALLKVRTTVQDKLTDFMFIEEDDFDAFEINSLDEFLKEHQNEHIPLVLVAHPSMRSIVIDQKSYDVALLQKIYDVGIVHY